MEREWVVFNEFRVHFQISLTQPEVDVEILHINFLVSRWSEFPKTSWNWEPSKNVPWRHEQKAVIKKIKQPDNLKGMIWLCVCVLVVMLNYS